MKKIKKKSLALRSNSLALQYVFGGQTASSLRPYGRNAQIICIGLQILTFSKCWASPPHLAKVGLRHALYDTETTRTASPNETTAIFEANIHHHVLIVSMCYSRHH